MRPLHALAVVWCLLLVRVFAANGAVFGVEGKSKYQIFDRGGKVLGEQKDEFRMIVDGCKWYIRLTPLESMREGKPRPLVEYKIVSYDSTNFYELYPMKGAQGIDFRGTIGPGKFPFGLASPKPILLWYAFGSSCYFESVAHDGYLPPVTGLMDQKEYAKDFRVAARYNLRSTPPFLPEIINFCAVPKYATERAETRLWQYTNYVYTAQQFVNHGGLDLPTSVSLEYFSTSGPLFRRTGLLVLEVERFLDHDAVGEQDFTPVIPSGAYVSDMRNISPETPFGVVLRGTNWPRLEETKKASKLQGPTRKLAEQASQRDVAHRSFKRRAIRVCLILLGATPIVLFGCWLTMKRKGSQNETNKSTA